MPLLWAIINVYLYQKNYRNRLSNEHLDDLPVVIIDFKFVYISVLIFTILVHSSNEFGFILNFSAQGVNDIM